MKQCTFIRLRGFACTKIVVGMSALSKVVQHKQHANLN